jgi:XTP/dITP diphosphohydrolase
VNKPISIPDDITQDQFGELLIGLIAQAVEKDIDPDAALRGAAKSLIERIKAHEAR